MEHLIDIMLAKMGLPTIAEIRVRLEEDGVPGVQGRTWKQVAEELASRLVEEQRFHRGTSLRLSQTTESLDQARNAFNEMRAQRDRAQADLDQLRAQVARTPEVEERTLLVGLLAGISSKCGAALPRPGGEVLNGRLGGNLSQAEAQFHPILRGVKADADAALRRLGVAERAPRGRG